MLARMPVARRKPNSSTAPMTRISAVPMTPVTSWRRRSEAETIVISLLWQLEQHPRLDRYLHRGVVDDRRGIAPALYGADGGVVEHARGTRLDHGHIAGRPFGVDGVGENHRAGEPCLECVLRIFGIGEAGLLELRGQHRRVRSRRLPPGCARELLHGRQCGRIRPP